MSFLTLLLLATAASPLPQDSWASLWKRLSETKDVRVAQDIMAAQPVGAPQGFAWLRVYQLTGDPKAGSAAENIFEKALEQSPQDPWLQFGYGEALALKNPKRFPLRAAKYLLEALRLDSLHVPAAAALGRLALASREKELLADAQSAATRITRHTANPELLNLMAEIAREDRGAATSTESARVAAWRPSLALRARLNRARALSDRRTLGMDTAITSLSRSARSGSIAQITKDLRLIGSSEMHPPLRISRGTVAANRKVLGGAQPPRWTDPRGTVSDITAASLFRARSSSAKRGLTVTPTRSLHAR
jgi:predicted Zn-dependent protease